MNTDVLICIFKYIDYPTACSVYRSCKAYSLVLEHLKKSPAFCLWKYELKYIETPDVNMYHTPFMEKKLVELYPYYIKYIENQTDDICMSSITSDPYNIQFIKNPTKKQLTYAIHRQPNVISVIEQTDELCRLAISINPYTLFCVSSDIINNNHRRLAVEQDVSIFQDLETYDESVAIAAVKQDCYQLNYIHMQSHKVCMAAIENDWRAIGAIDDQSMSLCLAAYRKNRNAANLIRSTTMRNKVIIKGDQQCLQQ